MNNFKTPFKIYMKFMKSDVTGHPMVLRLTKRWKTGVIRFTALEFRYGTLII